jgi:hypothetical protein
MKPEGIRKIIAEQGVEAAVCHLYEMLEALTEGRKPPVEQPLEPPPPPPVVEGEVKKNG